MVRFSSIAAAIGLALAPSLAVAGGGFAVDETVVPLVAFPGPVNPMARGALYNTPPGVTFRYAYAYRRVRHIRRALIRVRY